MMNFAVAAGQELHVEYAAGCHAGRYICTAADVDGTTVRCGAAVVTLAADVSEDPTACITAACAAASVTSLPGWEGPLPSRHYSGFVDVSANPGTTPGRFLHYWLVEAEDVDPATAPLVLWLNGGPGCSSMDGFWHETGPFRVDRSDDTKIHRNPHTWAKISNMIFLEAPVGTGYSYTDETDTPHIGDEATARDSHTFLERFLGAEYFPQFAPMLFHIWVREISTFQHLILKFVAKDDCAGRVVRGDLHSDSGQPDPARERCARAQRAQAFSQPRRDRDWKRVLWY